MVKRDDGKRHLRRLRMELAESFQYAELAIDLKSALISLCLGETPLHLEKQIASKVNRNRATLWRQWKHSTLSACCPLHDVIGFLSLLFELENDFAQNSGQRNNKLRVRVSKVLGFVPLDEAAAATAARKWALEHCLLTVESDPS